MKFYRYLSIQLLVILTAVVVFQSGCCTGKPPEPVPPAGHLFLSFQHVVDGNPITFDTMIYQNEAGNPYLVSEIQYFVSDFTLWKNGQALLLDKDEDIHYVDTDIPSSLYYNPSDNIYEGDYDSLTFVFGITKEKNRSFMFVNPPESYMFWPEHLGGGYHYMKLNGKWRDTNDVVQPFNFHLGIGQTYDDQGNITGFVQNYFTVHLRASSFKIVNGLTTKAVITMHVDEWFKDPNTFDFNYWGGHIMENQQAMRAAIENGHNVFSIKFE